MERARLHEVIGNALEALYGEGSPEIAVQLARHFEAAGLAAKAADYLLQTGNSATRMFANEEAIAHYQHGLKLLQALPEPIERARQELKFQMALAVPLKATKGFTAPEPEQTSVRARELCQHFGGTTELFQVLYGLSGVIPSELHTARELGDLLMELARRQDDPRLLTKAHSRQAATLMCLGELNACREHVDQELTLYDPRWQRDLPYQFDTRGLEAGCLSRSSLVFWHLGYPDQAAQMSQEAPALAEKLADPYTLAVVLVQRALFHQYQEVEAVREWANAVVALCSRQRIAFWLVNGKGMWGWALARQGQSDEGIVQLRESLAELRTSPRAEISYLKILRLPADACRITGQTLAGLALVDESLVLTSKIGCVNEEPNLY